MFSCRRRKAHSVKCLRRHSGGPAVCAVEGADKTEREKKRRSDAGRGVAALSIAKAPRRQGPDPGRAAVIPAQTGIQSIFVVSVSFVVRICDQFVTTESTEFTEDSPHLCPAASDPRSCFTMKAMKSMKGIRSARHFMSFLLFMVRFRLPLRGLGVLRGRNPRSAYRRKPFI